MVLNYSLIFVVFNESNNDNIAYKIENKVSDINVNLLFFSKIFIFYNKKLLLLI